MKKFLLTILVGLLAGFLVLGCDDDEGTTDPDTGPEDTDTGEAGTKDIGDYCWEREDCSSNHCATFRSVPPDPEGVCAEEMLIDTIRIMGNVRDILSNEPISGVEVKIAGASASIQDPKNASSITKEPVITDEQGYFEVPNMSTIHESAEIALGIVARVDPEDGVYHLCLGGMVEPELNKLSTTYPSNVRNHDIRVVSNALADKLSGFLKADPKTAMFYPMGGDKDGVSGKGGAVGLLLEVETGKGFVDATLQSVSDNSKAVIRYLDDDQNGLNEVGTGSSGLFVVLNPGVGEKFDAIVDEKIISDRPGTFGAAPPGIYTNTLHVLSTAK